MLNENHFTITEIINFLPDATFIINEKREVIVWNHAMEKLTGTKASDMLGKSDYEYSIPFYGERRPILVDLVLQHDDKILNKYKNFKIDGDTITTEVFVSRLNKEGYYLWVIAKPLYDSSNKIIGAIESIRDVTSRKIAEEEIRILNKNLEDRVIKRTAELESANQQLNTLISNLPEYIIVHIDGKIVFVSDSVVSGFGYSKEDMINSKLSDFVEGSYKENIVNNIVEEYELKILTKDKKHKNLIVRGGIINFRNQKATLTVMIDITERINLHAQLAHSEKLASIGTLSAGIAHEINNPLSIVKGNLEVLKHKLVDPSFKSLNDLIDVQLTAISRIEGIVHGLRNYSRADSEENEAVNIHTAIAEIMSLIESIYKKDQINFKINLNASKYYIFANYGKIQQVLMNLISNAKDAVEEKEKGLIKIDTVNRDDKIEIMITDNGSGIDAGIMERIFDPFFTTKPPGKGTGLGLSILYSIIKSYNGSIDVMSKKGKGSIFTITLPIYNK